MSLSGCPFRPISCSFERLSLWGSLSHQSFHVASVLVGNLRPGTLSSLVLASTNKETPYAPGEKSVRQTKRCRVMREKTRLITGKIWICALRIYTPKGRQKPKGGN